MTTTPDRDPSLEPAIPTAAPAPAANAAPATAPVGEALEPHAQVRLAALQRDYAAHRYLHTLAVALACAWSLAVVRVVSGGGSGWPAVIALLVIVLQYGSAHWLRTISRALCVVSLFMLTVISAIGTPIAVLATGSGAGPDGWWICLLLPFFLIVPVWLGKQVYRVQLMDDEIRQLTMIHPVVPPPDDLEGHDVNRWDEGGV